MTGHVGERTNRAVALVTDDFRVYHQVMPFLESRGIVALGLRPEEAVPPSVRVLIGGPDHDARTVALHDDLPVLWIQVCAALDARPAEAHGPGHAVIGVDPGQTIGLSVVVDGLVYDVAETSTVEDAVDLATRWAAGLQARACTVHVGDGAPEIGHDFVTRLAITAPTLDIVFVREEGSSTGPIQTISKHTDAAVRIALRRPL